MLEMNNITKIYDNGIVANDDVCFNLKKGEIHALVGENGAGKSTLMKMLFGMVRPTSGAVVLNGKELGSYESKDAIKMGIGMVHQHFMLVDDFTVSQNIMLGIEPRKGLFVDVAKSESMTLEVSKKYNLEVDPKATIESLPVGIKQKVEILKALVRGAKILILDEPTAVLTPQETELLFKELLHLKEMGYSIIFISHKIREVKEISSRVTIMRRGKSVGTFNTDDVSESELSNLIMGLELDLDYNREPPKPRGVGISVKAVSLYRGQEKPILKDINFNVKRGTILGIAGVQGNGQVELVQLMTKGMDMEKGDIEICGKSIRKMSVREMREDGYAYIPEDRLTTGVTLDGTIAENLIANRYTSKEYNSKGVIRAKKVKQLSKQCIDNYEVRCFDETQKMSMLSGGNMQKVVVARECEVQPKVIIAEQPTRGIDIGSAYIVHQGLFKLRDSGSAVLLVSADLNEVVQVCDELIVMYEGEIVAYFDDMKNIEEDELGLCMLGINRHTKEQIERVANE